jgi:hypothetical protein
VRRSISFVLILLSVLSLAAMAVAAEPGQPILITSAGQSADDMILKVMLERQFGNPVDRNPLAEASEVEGHQTLLLAVGVSNKGLGAAGINLEQEKARLTSVLDAAKAADCYVIMVHIGGPSRRGAGSDEVARLVAPYASKMIILADSNQDGFFDELAKEHDAALEIVESRNDVALIIADLVK